VNKQKLLNSKDIADVIGVGRHTVSRWARDGLIPFIKLPSGRLRFTEEHLREILSGNGKKSKA